MGATVQVNTSCQSVRFSRRPKLPLPVGINLTLLILSHTRPEAALLAFTSLQRVFSEAAHSANSAGTLPRCRPAPHRRQAAPKASR